MTDDLKTSVRNGAPVIGSWISIGHRAIPEITARTGYDFGLIDLEHTAISLDTLEEMVNAFEAADTSAEAVVRVPDSDEVRIKRALDTGVAGVMVPMVESASEARRIVDAVRYPPEGNRGIAGSRATGYGIEFEEYVENANQRMLTLVQIESEEGVRNADEIAAVDGVDALFVGPSDLSGSLDVFAEWNAPELTDAIERVLEAADSAETSVGTLVLRRDHLERRADQGFDFMIVGKDTAHIASGQRSLREAYDLVMDDRTGQESPANLDG